MFSSYKTHSKVNSLSVVVINSTYFCTCSILTEISQYQQKWHFHFTCWNIIWSTSVDLENNSMKFFRIWRLFWISWLTSYLKYLLKYSQLCKKCWLKKQFCFNFSCSQWWVLFSHRQHSTLFNTLLLVPWKVNY